MPAIVCQSYEFTEQAVGAFATLIDLLQKASTRKDRAKYTTMISGFVRSMHFVRTAEAIEGQLIAIDKSIDVKAGTVRYLFVFERSEEKQTVQQTTKEFPDAL